MNLEKFTQVIETCGSRASNWPESERDACMRFLKANASARHLLVQHQRLEAMLDEITVPNFLGLESKVANLQLPQQPVTILDSFINWLLPSNLGLQLWRPLTAACLPLVFGIMVGNYFSFGVNDESIPLESWDDELVLLSFNDLSDTAIEP
jgi:hypothetical protein